LAGASSLSAGVPTLSFPRFRSFLYLTTALVPWTAFGQGSVSQSGAVVPLDFTCWAASGIVKDCGVSSLNPIVLPVIPNGDLLGNATGGAAQAQSTSLTALIDTLGSAAQGDLLYRNGSGWVFLSPGSSGFFLQSQGVGANPAWAASFNSASLDTLGSPAQGDILYRNGSAWVYLTPGTNGQFLQTQGTAANPQWAVAPGTAYTAGSGLTLTGTAFSLTAPVTVALGGTGLAIGVSGGVLGYTATGTIASSALLAAHAVTLGGGVGATPYTLSTLGSSGQVLTSAGASADPTWSAATTYLAGTGLTLTGSTFSITAPVTVALGGTGLTAGVSGGIPGYTASGIMTSSALLTQHGVMLGGGAGLTPSALTSLGTSGQALLSNGAAADPSFQTIPNGTVTQINSGHCLTGGPITATGTIAAVDATSGVCGVVTPDTNAAHVLNGAGNWIAPVAAGTGIGLTGTTVSLLAPNLTGTTAAIGGTTLTAACASGTIAIGSATTAMAVVATPVVYPGDAIRWGGYVSSAGTVTVKVCADVNGTPASGVYVVKVIPG
jgi:hypothetical protein